MSEKAIWRIGSIGLSLLLLMLAVTIQSNLQMMSYRRQLENSYLHSLQEVGSQMNAISLDLRKWEYAGTPAQVSAISAQVWKNAGTAKAALASLPVEGAELEETYRFLSQVGDYSMYLSRKAVRGEEITEEEWENFEKLIAYAGIFSQQLADLQYKVGSGEMGLDELLSSSDGFRVVPEAVAVNLDMSGMERQPDGYPTLIYDGPFSDNLLDKAPTMTADKPEVSLSQAAQAAAQYAGVPVEQMRRGADEDSHMPSYTFVAGEAEVGVTKAGGYVTYLVSGREIGPGQIEPEEAKQLARAFLEGGEIGALQETYYELSGGILTVNYAYSMEDVLCYTDLVKVGVAMDDGQVVFYDARGFLNNHKERHLEEPSLLPEQAEESVSARLQVNGNKLALIPTAGGNEVLAYEFACKGRNGEDVLVYINAWTGAEEQIFILIENEYGTLAV